MNIVQQDVHLATSLKYSRMSTTTYKEPLLNNTLALYVLPKSITGAIYVYVDVQRKVFKLTSHLFHEGS